MEQIGTDVSYWQGDVNWQAMERAGIKFAIIRATMGGGGVDGRWQQNRDGILQTGILPGCYHFYKDSSGPLQQAAWFAQHTPDGFVPVVDCEDIYAHDGIGARLLAFLQEYENITGVRPVIYTAAWWWNPWIGAVSWASDYPLWVANYQYSTDGEPILPSAWEWWDIWQYSNKGDGYGESSQYIDLNVFRGSANDLEAWWGQHVTGGSAPPPEPPPDSNLWRVTASRHLNLRDAPNGKDVGNTYPGDVLLATGQQDGDWREFVVWAHTGYMEQV